ncbi:MAG: sensor histidine kinase [Actinomycetota bacterium]
MESSSPVQHFDTADTGTPGRRSADRRHRNAMEQLVRVVQELSLARDLDAIMGIVRRAARELTGADGATFVLRDGNQCHYAEENAISPLWKGMRFPMEMCISGWVMLNRQSVVIEDIYADPRIPAEAYRPTFVKSLAMVPIRTMAPLGAIGNYWAKRYRPSPEQVRLLQLLADTTAVAMENVQVYSELEHRVAVRTAELQAINSDLESFSYSVAHDLRAPLRSISFLTQLIQKQCGEQLDDDGKAHFEQIIGASQRMNDQIDGLMTLARVSRDEIRGDPVDLSSLARRLLQEIAESEPGRQATFDIEPGLFARGDARLLEQAMFNLLSNAWKYTGQTETPVIRFHAREEGGRRIFCISDNGAGFDMKYADKLFKPFQRLHSYGEFPGVGVGLATVQRIIERHGGTISAAASPGEGACFSFSLPD